MAVKFPSLDVHAHVDPDIHEMELLSLRAVLMLATRSQNEHAATASRADPLAVWGVGIHPGIPAAFEDYNEKRLRDQVRQSPLLSEIGLDRRSHVPAARQETVFRSILTVHDETPCIASVHSAGRTTRVLEMIEGHRCSTIVLHWWTGNAEETQIAIDLGCHFSMNPRNVSTDRLMRQIPADRVLTETDHPYGDRGERGALPGRVSTVEEALEDRFGASGRVIVWTNFARLVLAAGVSDRLPSKIAGLVAVASEQAFPPISDNATT